MRISYTDRQITQILSQKWRSENLYSVLELCIFYLVLIIPTLFFNQLVTRCRRGQTKSNLLDLVLTNNSSIVNGPVGKSDHATIILNLDVDVYEDVHLDRRLYYKSDYKGMRDYFTEINWSRI